MRIQLKQLCVIGAFFLMVACESKDDTKKVLGSWAGVTWTANGQPSQNDAEKTFFSFDTTGAYTYTYAGHVEKGTFKVSQDELFTTPQNELEMMVKIAKATTDTLVFKMSRGGQEEELTLVRR